MSKPETTVMGIDPGVTGAIVCLGNGFADATDIWDMPTSTVKVNNKNRKRIHLDVLRAVITRARPDVVYLENVWPRQGEGTSSAFTFGEGFGMVRGILCGLDIKTVLVTPMAWKKSYGMDASKLLARHVAAELFPRQADWFARVKDDGRAEAALIALYGAHKER